MYNLNHDQTTFFRLANTFARGFISLNNLYDDKRVSLHKAIACKAKRIVNFYINALALDQVEEMLMLRDDRGFNCIDYARLSGEQDIIKSLNDIQKRKPTVNQS